MYRERCANAEVVSVLSRRFDTNFCSSGGCRDVVKRIVALFRRKFAAPVSIAKPFQNAVLLAEDEWYCSSYCRKRSKRQPQTLARIHDAKFCRLVGALTLDSG